MYAQFATLILSVQNNVRCTSYERKKECKIVAWRNRIYLVYTQFAALVPSVQNNIQLMRLPVCFKSVALGCEHDHIVLAVRDGCKWGALGISRLNKLMFKELKFSSLFYLIIEFIGCYKEYHHGKWP